LSDEAVLQKILNKIDRKGYKAYKDLEGEYNLGLCTIFIDHVQSDPFAPPSRFRARVSANKGGFPEELVTCSAERIATEDFLARCFSSAIHQKAKVAENTPKINRTTPVKIRVLPKTCSSSSSKTAPSKSSGFTKPINN